MNKLKKKIKKISKENIGTFFALFVVICVGVYLRIGSILSNSFAFTYDVGRDLLQVQDIVANGNIPLIGQTTGLGGLFYGPWWYYILTPAFVISQGNPQGIVFFMMIVGVATILASYYLGKVANGRMLGVIFASLVSFSPVMIGYSNQIWNPNIAPFLSVCVFIVIEKLTTSKKRFLLFLVLGVLSGLIIDSEILFGVLFTLAIFIGLLFQYKKSLFKPSFLGIFIGLFVIFLPRIVFEIRHSFIMSKTILTPKENGEGLISLSTFFIEIPNRLTTVFNQFSETLAFNNPILGGIFLGISIVVLVWNRKNLSSNSRRLLAYGLIIILVFIFGTSIFDRAIWGHYVVGLPVIYIFFIGSSLFVLAQKYKYLGLVVFVFYMICLINPIQEFRSASSPIWEGDAAVYRNQVQVIDYIYKDADGRGFNYIAYTPAVHDFPYQYLFSWYGKKHYGFNPSEKTENLFYVIIEPDPGYEGRVRDWLKVREGDGKIENEQLVKGGIVVQKRTR